MRAHLPLLRLQAARALAWALLLGGWVGLASLAQARTASPASAFALLALWLLALGGFAALAGRLPLPRAVLGGLLLVAGAAMARALQGSLAGAGGVSLLPVVLGAALLVAMASAVVRACRQALRVPAGPPVASAAVGALLAWAGLGDIGDLPSLAARLAVGATAAGVLFALLLVGLPRRHGAAGGCRAGLFDCSMPAWSAAEWREPAARPAMLAQLTMLPMMGGLPWMVSMCRGEAVTPAFVVGVHFAAMFVPALLLTNSTWLPRAAPALCALLLALGAMAVWAMPGGAAWWGLALAHGAAWSVAWSARLHDRAVRRPAPASALGGAALNAALVLALGAGLAGAGLQALAAWHVALGLAGALVGVGAWPQRLARA